MNKPKVSVIIPAYNAESSIGRVLDGLSKQSYDNLEIIVVNDGSTDKTLDEIIKSSKKDLRIKYFSQDNLGASSARNLGIKKSNGEFIVFFDADDDFDKNIIKIMVDEHKKNPVDLVVCGMIVNGNAITSQDQLINSNKGIVRYVLNSLLKQNLFYGPCCKLYKKDIVDKISLRFNADMRYGEDTVFVIRYISAIDSLSMISQALYRYNYTTKGVAFKNRKNKKDRKLRRKSLISLFKKQVNLLNAILTLGIMFRWWLSSLKAAISHE